MARLHDPRRAAEHLGSREPGHGLEGGIDVMDDAIRVGNDYGIGGLLHAPGELLQLRLPIELPVRSRQFQDAERAELARQGSRGHLHGDAAAVCTSQTQAPQHHLRPAGAPAGSAAAGAPGR